MSNNHNARGLRALIAVLAVALIAVAALIAWKQAEYRQSESFYDGLRGGCVRTEGACV